MYALFLKIENQPCLIVGGGKIAVRKIGELITEGAKVTVVTPRANKEILEWSQKGAISLENREYRTGDTKGFFLVIAATNNHELNRIISEEAGTTLFNSVDEPDICNFYSGAVIKRGKLRIAISTSGAFPALARKIKKDLNDSIPASYERLLDKLGEFRSFFIKNNIPEEKRKQVIDRIVQSPAIDEFLQGNEEPLNQALEKCI
jgi:precorrin-2 dehydrogenase / sirohydrochlorin ferrochelatase